ncbi:MAG: NAD-binding protein [Myxococcaceae bacterium]
MSMVVTPLLVLLNEKVIKPRFFSKKDTREFDVAAEQDTPVIVAGFGRVGQVVGRMLNAKKIAFTAMDASPEHIDFIKKFGNKVFYGDASRLDLLRAARADKAKIFVLAVDDMEASVKIAETVQQHFPHLTIFARARNRQHAYKLMALGIKHVMRETFLSSLEMTGDILEELGLTWTEAHNAMERFRQYDEQLLEQNFKFAGDIKELQARANASRDELEKLFDSDTKTKKSA